ncbi:alcohol dehydrogenase [Ktedonobacteria bacterium brp13]|nr:alcohol dehydrogenase [Ktedonobacteria bacterium brp13]
MKAAILEAPATELIVTSIDCQEPQAGEVLVKLAASGVCHSDLHVIHGTQATPLPVVLGHEGAGIVEAVGPNVTQPKVGDHVVLSWVPYCGQCSYCLSGRPNLCSVVYAALANGTLLDGTSRLSRGGAPVYHYSFISSFAEYAVVPASGCIVIQPDIPLDIASLVGCAVMTGVGAALNTAHVRPGSSVAVIGAGGVGLNIMQGAQLAGAASIIAIDINPAKLEQSVIFGATQCINSAQTDAVTAVRELTGGLGVDYSFEAVGRPQTMRQCWEMARPGGTVVMVGIAPDGSELVLPATRIVREERHLLGSFYGSARPHIDMPMILELYMAGKLKLDELATHRFSLAHINEAVHLLEVGEAIRPIILYD